MRMKKTVIINRAVPGSGKTTITKCILKALEEKNISSAIHSTEEYSMENGKYVFDVKKLKDFHDQNLVEFNASLDKKVNVVICDNTNLLPWQSEPYTNLARKYDYQIIFISLDPRDLEKHVLAQQVTIEKPDAHSVSREVLKEMIFEYHLFDSLLDKNSPIDSEKHFHYYWDDEICKKISTGKLAKHFDSDFVIRILPTEYKDFQRTIGQKVLALLKDKK